MLRSGKARRTVFATADPPEQLVAKRSSAGRARIIKQIPRGTVGGVG